MLRGSRAAPTLKPMVRIYTKTHCPYSLKAKRLLSDKGVAFDEIDIAKRPERRDEMVEASNGGTTVPQVFIGERHLGGCDDLYALDQRGELDPLLARDTSATA